MIRNYIFTITAGRSGQATLYELLKNNATGCLCSFEAPYIKTYLPWIMGDLEKSFRRKFIETNEMLGRGKILEAYEKKNYKYIEKIAQLRLKKINKEAILINANTYFDISKYYVRGLHIGFNRLLKNISLVFLVRDPLCNMKSFINRNKNFFLDNSRPDSNSNLLKIRSNNIIKEELYLWAWSEVFLRFNSISRLKKVKKSIVIKTADLNCSKKIIKSLNYLGINYKPFKEIEKKNTNIHEGFENTIVTKEDLKVLKNFILKMPKGEKDLIKTLNASILFHEANSI